jgi:hypothetical protein
MISRLKIGLFLAAGVVLLLGANFAFDRVDEALGCGLGDHAWDCVVQYGWKAVHNWWAADDYRQFLEDGPARAEFLSNTKTQCVAYHKAQHIAQDKTDEQIVAYCGCWAQTLVALATPTDLRYIARHEVAPQRLQQELEARTPQRADLANSVGVT